MNFQSVTTSTVQLFVTKYLRREFDDLNEKASGNDDDKDDDDNDDDDNSKDVEVIEIDTDETLTMTR